MKRSITTALAFLLVATLGLAGCKKKDADNKDPSTKVDDKPAAGKPGEPAGDNLAATNLGVPDCDAYYAAMAKFIACPKLTPDMKEGYQKSTDMELRGRRDNLKSGAQTKEAAAAECKTAMTGLVEGAKFRDCPL
jgi:hypothetical protein